ncbi:MAG: cob(I)yrinic acid a,c-diamide adenosyltransferase [Clostridium sp.]|nr:cob(I)yrinic acid a,c-diamide adenosyltransferase [Clostridium sp.]
MIHLYFGSGKGKTTAAIGLALRAAGRGLPVTVAQFLKGSDTGERSVLSHLPGTVVLDVPDSLPFLFQMSPGEREAECQRSLALLAQAEEQAGRGGLLILDEVCDAVNEGLIPLETLLALLEHTGAETVLTGRAPHQALLDRADYITRFEKLRHPYDQGTPPRPGIEL